MAHQITVEEIEKGNVAKYRVTVVDDGGRTQHIVSVAASYRDCLVGEKIAVEQFVAKSFEFLLKREPKESILRQFDLRAISRYSPEYEKEMRREFGMPAE
jgi:hypothetical protein